MPHTIKYEVDTRYNTDDALKQKLQKLFPYSRVSDFDVKVKLPNGSFGIFRNDVADK